MLSGAKTVRVEPATALGGIVTDMILGPAGTYMASATVGIV